MTQNEPRLLANPKLKREHGGNTESVASQFDLEPGCLLDFSANVNPLGLPPKASDRLAREAQNIGLLRQYPDWEASELRHVLSLKHGIAIDRLVIGAGASELIAASLRALKPRHCLCPIPAFSEYHSVCQVSGCGFSPFPLDPARNFSLDVERLCHALGTGAYDLLILNNPHNPSGALLGSERAFEILAQTERMGIGVILDEAFIYYAPAASLTGQAARRAGGGRGDPFRDQVLWLSGAPRRICRCLLLPGRQDCCPAPRLACDDLGAQRRRCGRYRARL
ncbi:MAG: aminotransferase class I/II-fold pyridoxal phosphate-dependent enzyme [Acidobacteria bacterium]|nr:aminotransferase class I/II-fold pyridoxal phosphate-dependent enzyme [Acidobacteriota bacterium]